MKLTDILEKNLNLQSEMRNTYEEEIKFGQINEKYQKNFEKDMQKLMNEQAEYLKKIQMEGYSFDSVDLWEP